MKQEAIQDGRVLNEFISRTFHRRMEVTQVINVKWAETSNSVYVVIECNHHHVYELAISDHRNYSHRFPMDPMVGKGALSRHKLRASMATIGIKVPNIHTLDADHFYSINRCYPYRMNPKGLIDRYSSHLAFMSECYEVQDAILSNDKQVLTIKYTNADHTQIDYGIYVNYDPIEEGCSEKDIIAINYLKNNYDIKTARRIYYRDWYELQTLDEYRADMANDSISFHQTPNVISNYEYQNTRQLATLVEDDEFDDEFEVDGTKYILSLAVDNPQIVMES